MSRIRNQFEFSHNYFHFYCVMWTFTIHQPFVLVMLCQKHVNMSQMKLRWVWPWKKLIWKMQKLFSKKQLCGLKYLERVNMNGKMLAMRLTCNTKFQTPFENMFCFQHNFIPINLSQTPLPHDEWSSLYGCSSMTHS